jgi:hypothetical protein
MYPHRIRLRGPWEATNADGSTQRVDLPGGWHQFISGGDTIPKLVRRRFGLPRTLDPDEHVFLMCRFDGRLSCELNEQPINLDHASGDDAEWNVTRLLQARNVVAMSFWPGHRELDPPEVSLEIRGPVYLQDVSATPNGWVGQVIGEDRPHLELHLLARGRAIFRIAVKTNERFVIPFPVELPDGSYSPLAPLWQLELIELANRWYSVELPAPPGIVPR